MKDLIRNLQSITIKTVPEVTSSAENVSEAEQREVIERAGEANESKITGIKKLNKEEANER